MHLPCRGTAEMVVAYLATSALAAKKQHTEDESGAERGEHWIETELQHLQVTAATQAVLERNYAAVEPQRVQRESIRRRGRLCQLAVELQGPGMAADRRPGGTLPSHRLDGEAFREHVCEVRSRCHANREL